MINLETRRPVRFDDELSNAYAPEDANAFGEELPRVKEPLEYELEYSGYGYWIRTRDPNIIELQFISETMKLEIEEDYEGIYACLCEAYLQILTNY